MRSETSNEPPVQKTQKAFTERLSLWVGILGSVITISLTIWNARVKNQIDNRAQDLEDLKARLEQSKAQIEVYKWVATLLPNLEDKDKTKRVSTINMINLVLSDADAKKLFAGLQTSDSEDLRLAGQSGLATIRNESIASVVDQLNASDKQARLQAAEVLERDYTSSPVAINLVLHLYDEDRIGSLSADGMINGLFYLNRTDPTAWNADLVQLGTSAKSRIDRLQIGTKTRGESANFGDLLKAAAKGR
jgi:hypothetical protein